MIEKMLNEYREKKALLCFKERDIEALKQQLEYNNQVYIESDYEAIEGMSMTAAILSDIPKSVTNKFSSVTEETAIGTNRYGIEKYHTNDFDYEILSIKLKIARLEEEAKPYREIVETVDIAMKVLDAKEKFVIIRKYLRGYTIPEIVTHFAKNYGYGSKNTIERIIEAAILKMDNLLKKKSA